MRTYAFAAGFAAAALTLSQAQADVLPNGWSVQPAGALTALGTLPLHMANDRSGEWVAVTVDGYASPVVTIVDASTGRVADSKPLDGAFYGIAFSPDDSTLYVSTAGSNGVERFGFDKSSGKLTDRGSWRMPGDVWTSGLAVSPDGATLYVTGGLSRRLYALGTADGSVRWTAPTGAEPLAVVLSGDGSRAYVSDWAGSTVSIVDTRAGKTTGSIDVSDHPNALALSADGKTLYVACSMGDDVDAIDVAAGRVRERYDAGLWPRALEGTTPSGLALSPDGRTLYVADSGDDAVTAIDIASGRLIGALPAGWYPTDVDVAKDGSSIFILDGDGITGHPNPAYGHPAVHHANDSLYIGSLLTGDLERAPLPDAAALSSGLATARAAALYRGGRPQPGPRSSLVRHVIYVIKENRTYDEILGDDARGDGDASLAIFGRTITPNIHRLADDFVLFDRFEENGFVSVDGHNWADAAYADDYVDKLWPAAYAGRGRDNDSFFGDDPPAVPGAGYLWDDALAHGLTLRDYGEFVLGEGKSIMYQSRSLRGHTDPLYRGWDLKYGDQSRIDEWMREFAAYERNGGLPDLEIVYLPDDHTGATRPGYRTPYAMLASNDYAVGRLVDRLSHSRYWRDTVAFVVEDDSQAGPDHVSAQRAEALMVGGPVRRGVVSHAHYTQCSVLRTIEMLLGLPPMSQFDAGAEPMTPLLASAPDVAPWTASKPNLSLDKRNTPRTAHAHQSAMLDLSAPDASNAAAFNAILLDYARATPLRSSRGPALP